MLRSRPQHMTAGLLMAAAGSIAFSGKAIIVKLAYRYGVDAVTLLMFRMLFALPLFVLMAWWAGRGKGPIAVRDWWGILGLGFCGYYLASFLDFWGLEYISASLERLILYLNPTIVLVLGWLLYGRQISRRQGVGMLISYAGVLLVFGHEAAMDGQNAWLGAGLVMGSAISYALYLSYSGQLVQRLGSLRLAGWATSVACVLCIGQFLWLRPLQAADVATPVLWLSVLNATACTAVPVLLVMMAIERIGSSLTAQTGMIGPMSTLLMGVVILGEPFNVWIVGGTVLVLSGVFWVTRAPKI
ncbi:DMT family transporter [Limnohabitans sp. DCL3]|uniref:DMT family transporter n=1 Tax=Limnohabitans sp. DCL3 TaxID=3374103 RepID=UPI003A898B59